MWKNRVKSRGGMAGGTSESGSLIRSWIQRRQRPLKSSSDEVYAHEKTDKAACTAADSEGMEGTSCRVSPEWLPVQV